jgi:hypothetical protein
VFKSILISVAIAPVLLGVLAAKGRDGGRDLAALRVGWVAYAVLWFAALFYLRYR